MSHRKQLTGRRVGHKSTGGILLSIPEPVDPVANAAPLKSNTVARHLVCPRSDLDFSATWQPSFATFPCTGSCKATP